MREGGAPIGCRIRPGILPDRNVRGDRQSSFWMHHLAVVLVKDDLGTTRAGFIADLCEERAKLVVLVLRPALKRVIVTLRS